MALEPNPQVPQVNMTPLYQAINNYSAQQAEAPLKAYELKNAIQNNQMTMADKLAQQEALKEQGGGSLTQAYVNQYKLAAEKEAAQTQQAKAKSFFDGYEKILKAHESGSMTAEQSNKMLSGLASMSGIEDTFKEKGMDFSFTNSGGFYSGPVLAGKTKMLINGQPVPFPTNGIVEGARVVGLNPDGTATLQMTEKTKFKNSEGKAAAPQPMTDKGWTITSQGGVNVASKMGENGQPITEPYDPQKHGVAQKVSDPSQSTYGMIANPDPNAQGWDILNNYQSRISEKANELVQRQVALGGFNMRDPEWKAAFDVAHQIDPTLSMQDYHTQLTAKKAFVGSGKYAVQSTALDTAAVHMAAYKKALDKLNMIQSSFPGSGVLESGVSFMNQSVMRSPEWKAAEAARKIVEADVAGVLKAGIGNASPSTEDINHWKDLLNFNNNPREAVEGGLKQMADLAGNRQGQIYENYDRSVGRNAAVPEFISPSGKKAFETLGLDSDQYIPDTVKDRVGPSGYGGGAGKVKSSRPSLPPAAASQLRKGQETEFGNGQVWTLNANGVPTQVR